MSEAKPYWVGYLGHGGGWLHYVREFETASLPRFDQVSVRYVSPEDKVEDWLLSESFYRHGGVLHMDTIAPGQVEESPMPLLEGLLYKWLIAIRDAGKE